MAFLFSVVYWIGVTGGILALLAFISRRFFQVDRLPDSLHFTSTEDGWCLALARHRAQGAERARLPLLLVPGFGLGGVVFDYGPISLVEFLSEAGHDVWVLDPRGHGASSRPRLWGGYRRRWSFDDIAEFDLPAAIDAVRDQTGAPEVQVIGLGLGGVATCALLSVRARRDDRCGIRSCVVLGGALYFRRMGDALPPRLLRAARLLPMRGLVRLLGPLLGRIDVWPAALLANTDNVDGGLFRRALINSAEGVSRVQCAQLARWAEHDEFSATDGRDYRAGLAQVTTPSLFVTGAHDPLAPLTMSQRSCDALGAEDKQMLLAGRQSGMSANYGHLDLLLGRNAHRDIFPAIVQWLVAHDGTGTAVDPPQPGERDGLDVADLAGDAQRQESPEGDAVARRESPIALLDNDADDGPLGEADRPEG